MRFIFLLWLLVSTSSLAAGPYYYMLEKPLEMKTSLDMVSKAAHYLGPGSILVAKSIPLAMYTPVYTSVPTIGFLVAKYPVYVYGESSADLMIRNNIKQKVTMKQLNFVPGVKSVQAFQGSTFERQGALAAAQKSRAMVFFETDEPLEEKLKDPNWRKKYWSEKWGEVRPVSDLENTKLEMRFHVNGTPHEKVWTPSIAELMAEQRIDGETKTQWVDAATEANKKRTIKDKLLHKNMADLELEGTLLMPNGERKAMGTLMTEGSTKAFLGKSLWQKIMAKIGRDKIGQMPKISAERVAGEGMKQGACRIYYRALGSALEKIF